MPTEGTKKIKYVDEDPMSLVIGVEKPQKIQKGDILEFPEGQANGFLRKTKTVIEKYKEDKKTKVKIPVLKTIPKWVEVDKAGK